ncbi:hypothetical protein STSP2_02075 [Anaerohalosphaera lusitana]|uniref:Uncharacterized protein n=2 Tax=Anaerohalosphaera lusitana TaxID=1936003 RepID=A0A1U9NME0_9BACT|nr:hypothetical protein STSP2_02075 [Anaerohalosphaera lusitana]
MELLVSLMVSSIIFGAIATIAHAMSTANTHMDEMGKRQAHLRHSSLRISSLIRDSIAAWRLDYNVALWTGDSNADGGINADEVIYIETSSDGARISLVDFPDDNRAATVSSVKSGNFKSLMKSENKARTTDLITDCSSVWFELVGDEFVSITFNMDDGAGSCKYQICETLAGSGAHLIDTEGLIN